MVSKASWVSDFSQLDFTNTLLVAFELQRAIDQTIDAINTLALIPPICRWCFLSLAVISVEVDTHPVFGSSLE